MCRSPQGRPYPAHWVSILTTAVRVPSLLWLVWFLPSLLTTIYIWIALKSSAGEGLPGWGLLTEALEEPVFVPLRSNHLCALVNFNIPLPSSFYLALVFDNSLPFLRRCWLPFSFLWHLDFYLLIFPCKLMEFFFLWKLKGEIIFSILKTVLFLNGPNLCLCLSFTAFSLH